MKKLLFALLITLIAIPASAQSMKMVVDSKGRAVGRYIKTSGNHYVVDIQDYSTVPKAGHRVVTFSAAKGQGVVYRNQNRTGNIRVRKGPSTSTAIVGLIPDNVKEGCVPETYPCLGKSGNWYKIRINGKVGYVRDDMAEWDGMDTF